MKKLLISLSVLLLVSGCGNEEKSLSCTQTSESNGLTTNTKYDIEYEKDKVKYVTITYDYTQNTNNNNDNKEDGQNAETDGLTEDNTNNNESLDSNDVVDGVVGDTIDSTIDGIKETILDLAGIKNNYQNQMNTYDNIEGFSYSIDTDNDNEYKIIYKIDMDKISDNDLDRFDLRRDFSEIKTNYENLGYTCK